MTLVNKKINYRIGRFFFLKWEESPGLCIIRMHTAQIDRLFEKQKLVFYVSFNVYLFLCLKTQIFMLYVSTGRSCQYLKQPHAS